MKYKEIWGFTYTYGLYVQRITLQSPMSSEAKNEERIFIE